MYVVTNFCYLCLGNTTDLACVDITDNDGILVKDKLKFCVPEIVGINHEITKYVCSICLTNIKSFFIFKRACIQTTATLNNCFQNLPFTNEPNKQLTLSLASTKCGNTQVLLVKAGTVDHENNENNLKPGVNNEPSKNSVHKSPNIKLILPSLQKTKVKTVKRDAKRLLLPKENNQTSDGREIKNLLLPKDKSIEIKTVDSVLPKNVEVNKKLDSAVKQTVGNNDSVVIEEATIRQEIKSEVIEPEYVENEEIFANCQLKSEIEVEEEIQPNSAEREVFIKEELSRTESTDEKSQNVTSKIDKKKQKIENRKNKRRNNIKRHKCLICFKMFKEMCQLRIHEKIHLGIKEYQCDICQKHFTQKCNLFMHKKIHAGEKKFECTSCKKKFTQKGQLKIHQKIHKEEKNYECKFCKRKFVQKVNLEYHEKCHNGGFDYKCTVCDKKFIRKEYFARHMKKHSNKYECEICQKHFVRESNYARHLKIHNLISDVNLR